MSNAFQLISVIYISLGLGVVIMILLLMAALSNQRVEPTVKDVPELKRKLMGLLEEENDPQELSDIIWYIEVTRKRGVVNFG